MVVAKRVLRILALLIIVLVVLGPWVFFFLTRTQRGQGMVLAYVLGQLQGAIQGEIDIEGIRSPSLLGGATLIGVEVREREGRPLLVADSVELSYRWSTFLRGSVLLDDLTVFRPRLTLSRYPGEESFNFDRMLLADSASAAPARRIEFTDVRLVDGLIEILEPVDPADPLPPRMITTRIPGVDAALHRIWFENIQAVMSRVILSSPQPAGPEARVDSLSMIGHVYEDPFRLTQLEGTVSWADGKLVIVADEISLPETRTEGRIVVDFTAEGRGGRSTGWAVDMQLESPNYALRDFKWLLPTLPEGRGKGSFNVRFTDLGEVSFGFEDADLTMGSGRIAGAGTFTRAGVFAFRDTRISIQGLAASELKPFLDSVPFTGNLQGDVTLHGPLENLRAQGRLTLIEPGYEISSADFSGIFHLGESRRGVTNLVAQLDPVDLRLLTIFLPSNRLGGVARGQLQATGNLDEGLQFETDLVHDAGGALPTSRLVASGTVRSIPDDMNVDVQANVSPLSLTALRAYFPDLPFSGEVTGTIRANGPLANLALRTDLETPAGHLALDGRLNAREPGAFYRLEGELGEFALSRLVPELPEPTVVSGAFSLEGRGTDLATATADVSLSARASRIWELDVDTARVAVRVRDGVLHVDTANALVSGVALRAEGTLAATEGGPPGQIRVVFQSDSLQALRPVLMGRDVRVRDGLTELEREMLIAQGVDPDTLPTAEEVVVSGQAEGEVTLTGSLQSFSARGSASFEELRFGLRSLEGAEVTFSAEGLPDLGRWSAHAVTDSISFSGLAFRNADVTVSYARPTGSTEIFLERNDRESYRAIADFHLDSLGGFVDLQTLSIRLDSVTWNLERTATVAWDSAAVRVSGLTFAQTGGGGGRIFVDGTLPREGEVDLSVDVQGLRLEDVSRMLQRDRSELAGNLDLTISVRGLADRPLIVGNVLATDVSFESYTLDRVQGDVEYRDRRLILDLEASEEDRRVLQATGFIPATIDLSQPSFGFPAEQIDLRVVAEDLPAAFAAALFPILTDVQGTVAGEFDIGGTVEDPEPSGQLALQGAAWTIEAVGVRHEGVQGTLTLRPDAMMEVEAIARADGTAYVSGTVLLAPLRNPGFDLNLSFDGFHLAERRDVDAHSSGVITLTGTFERPIVQGLIDEGNGLYIDRGVLYLEEAVRAATVVDLSDPRFASFVDSILEPEILEQSQNPFMQNLVMNVDLVVQQNTWLRSEEKMNVEIEGGLGMQYDRARQELILVGELQAVRGPYWVLGHRFDVQQGTIRFIGLPGIDPDLNILARTRVRRQGEPLDIFARVTGRLTQPRVELFSEEAAISQSDLVSYLLFGVPSYELASSQRALLDNTAGAFLGAGARAGFNVFRSAVTSRVGTILAQQWGLDYFAITEAGNLGWDVSSVSQTQVEIGQYLSRDLFLVLAFQPVQVVGDRPFNTFGLRVEYSPSSAYTLQAFWEDRFLRRRTIGFQDLAFRSQKILGLSLFTEWGY